MAQEQLECITGTVEDIVYKNEDTGFAVIELASDSELITVVGTLPLVGEGEELTLNGRYVHHPTFGVQFKAQLCERRLPANANAIYKYLASGSVKGIGPATARKIVDLFGDDTLEVLEKSCESLTKIKGITLAKARAMREEYLRAYGVKTVMVFLAKYNLSPMLGIKIWKEWGPSSIDRIEKDPYLLASAAIGVEFEQADEIALSLGIDKEDGRRLKAGLIYVLEHNEQNGHTCLPYEKLCQTAAAFLEVGINQAEDMLDALIEQEIFFTKQIDKRDYVYLCEVYNAERYIAGRLCMAVKGYRFTNRSYDQDIAELEKTLHIQYAALQREAIVSSLNSGVFILTGGPGTGKTTTLNGMITLMEQAGEKVVLCAPTGRAAKRLSDVTGREAKTIHRLLEAQYGERVGFMKNERNPIECDAIVVDEMSVVDTPLFEGLLRALKMDTRIILVGDFNQLPSVGPGNILHDLIESGCIHTVALTEIFRQAAKSLIVQNAHRIVGGQYPVLDQKDNDFFYLNSPNAPASIQTVIDLCTRRLPQSYGFSPLWDIQVMCPTRIGPLGTNELNRHLQEALNPPQKEKKEQKTPYATFREGDKVMQVRNNYDIEWINTDGELSSGIYNGDIGVIEEILPSARVMMIRFDERVCQYSFDLLNDLELAYAITVHKSQGSEFTCVVAPLMDMRSKMYYRNLLYTMVTRAKKLFIGVGKAQTVFYMVENDRRVRRYTNLTKFIREEFEHE